MFDAAIDGLFGAQRVSIRPMDHTIFAGQGTNGVTLGHYRATVVTGTTVSVGAKGILSYLRWSPTQTQYVAAIMRLQVNASYVSSTITTGVVIDVAAYIRRGSTGNGSGGNAITLTTNNAKMRGNMGTSLVADARVATTAALTAPASGIQDANPIGYAILPATFQTTAPASGSPVTATIQTRPIDLYKWDALGAHPPVLQSGDDIEFCAFTAGPTTGGIVYSFTYEWAELPAINNF